MAYSAARWMVYYSGMVWYGTGVGVWHAMVWWRDMMMWHTGVAWHAFRLKMKTHIEVKLKLKSIFCKYLNCSNRGGDCNYAFDNWTRQFGQSNDIVTNQSFAQLQYLNSGIRQAKASERSALFDADSSH